MPAVFPLRRLALAALAALALTACGDSSTEPAGPPADVAGTWSFSHVIRDTRLNVECELYGLLEVDQDGETIAGSMSQKGGCYGPGGYAGVDGIGGVRQGRVEGSRVTFSVEECSYRASADASPAARLQGNATCSISEGGVAVNLTGAWSAVRGDTFPDAGPPGVSATIAWPAGDSIAVVPGDTVRLTIVAGDDKRLAWIGYRLAGQIAGGDSVEVSERGATVTLRLGIPPSWSGTSEIVVFARDAAGNVALEQFPYPPPERTLRVVAGVRRPAQAITLPIIPWDLAHDAKRSRLYLSREFNERVLVVALSPFAVVDSFAVGGEAAGLDLTPGGDTLVVALRRTSTLAFVNLLTRQVTTGEVFVPSQFRGSYSPDNVRVAANGKVLVTVSGRASISSGGFLAEYDLGTRTSRQRLDLPFGGNTSNSVPMAATPDRSRILMVDAGSCCPHRGYLYSSATDAISAGAPTTDGFLNYFNVGAVSSNAAGTRWLVGNVLLDESLARLTTFALPDPAMGNIGASLLSPDGATAWLATSYGYAKLRTSDGTVLERVRVPGSQPVRFILLPGGESMVVMSVDRLVLVDLR